MGDIKDASVNLADIIKKPEAEQTTTDGCLSGNNKSTCFVVPSPAHSVVGDPPSNASQKQEPEQHQPTEANNVGVDQSHETAAGGERITQLLTKFKPFTKFSYTSLRARIVARRRADEERRERAMDDARLVDGQLVVDEDIVEKDPKLAEGKALTKAVVKHFPKHLLGAPVEDIDPYYREYEETFMVISRRFNKSGFILRFSASPSLYMFHPWMPIRKIAIYTYTHPLFDLIVIFTILANSLYMAMNIDENVTEYTFLALYTFEAIVKAVARGLILTKHTYLRDPWNWLDFIVLVSAYATTIAQYAAGGASVNIQALRTFRVFRVLKTVAVIPGLKRIIEALMRSLKMLGDVYMMTVFFFTIFALFGVELFMGSLRSKCVRNADSVGISVNPNDTNYIPWDTWISNSSNWNLRDDGLDYQICGNASGAQKCRYNFTCLIVDSSPNPQYDFTNFDNFYSSFMVAIQMFNTDYWDYLYISVLSANGYGAFIWFIIGIVLLSYYLANLFQAVVALSYQVDDEVDDDQAPDAAVAGDVAKKKERKRFVFDPWKLRRISENDKMNVRSRSLMSVREVTMRKLRKSSLSQSNHEATSGEDITLQISNNGQSTDDTTFDTNGKPVAIVKPQVSHDDTKSMTPTKQPSFDSISINIQTSKSGWPGFANRLRYRVSSRPPSAVPADDLSKIGFWDRNPVCCMVCCIGYFPWLKVQHALMTLVTDPFFELLITATIVVNTVAMASYYYGIPDDINAFLGYVNDVCTYIFLAECALKLFAMCGEYFANRWNWLDFAVVLGSIVDIVFSNANVSFSGFNTSIIRLLRLLRILKLAKSWKTMRMLLEIIFGTIGAIGNLMLVLLIVIFIFAVIGMQLFSTSYTENKFMPGTGHPTFTIINGFAGVPEWNWSDFFHAFMLVFRVLCRETYQPMWDCITASSAAICVPFYLAILMIGSYVVLNLFMAVLLNAFSTETLSKASSGNEEDDRLKKRMKRIRAAIRQFFVRCLRLDRRISPLRHNASTVELVDTSTVGGGDNATTVVPYDIDTAIEHQGQHVKLNVPKDDDSHDKAQPHHHGRETATTSGTPYGQTTTSVTGSETGRMTRRRSTTTSVTGHSTGGDSDSENIVRMRDCCWPAFTRRFPTIMKPFSVGTRFGYLLYRTRLGCLHFCEHKAFEYTILGFIFASSISLCLQDANLADGSPMDNALSYLDYIYLGVFTLELLIKIFALGIRIYFTSFWTLLDFFIVVTGYADLVMGQISNSSNLTALRALRTLRALRPLRAISRWQGMKIVVNALIASIPPIANVLLVVMIIWLIFAIMGVQFFAGKFWYCIEIATGNRVPKALVPDRETCINDTRLAWGSYIINFDHIGNAYLSLLQVATFEGWTAVLQYAIDSADADGLQPSPDNSINYYVYFIVFIVICSFFLLNLFVGVIIDGFNALKKKYEGTTALQLFMTESQKQYYNTIRKLGSKKPKKTIGKPSNKFAALLFEIASSSRFEAAISVTIALNIVVLATMHYNQSHAYSFIQEMLDLAFTTIFCLEVVVLIIAFRHYYFRNLWHIFDFAVITLSVASYGIADWLEQMAVSPTVLHSLRLLRVGRVLRLIRASKGVRKLMFSFIMSLPALFNICCLLFLIIFIYAIIGMNLFGHIGHFGGNLDDIANFHTFPNALLTLFRLTTSSGWDNVHQGLSFSDDPSTGCQMNVSLTDPNFVWSNPCCNRTAWKRPNGEIVVENGGSGNCGNYSLAALYCVSYLLWTGFIIVNMFAAVILDNYQQAIEQEETGVTDDDIEHFYRVWETFDPAATQFIPIEELQNFAAALEPPLSCPKPNEHALTILDIPILLEKQTNREVFHCLDVLIALIRKALGYIDETEEFVQVREALESLFEKAFPNRVEILRISSTKQRKKQDIAARTIQKSWRNYVLEKSLRKGAKEKQQHSNVKATNSNSTSTTKIQEAAARTIQKAWHNYTLRKSKHLAQEKNKKNATVSKRRVTHAKVRLI